MFRRMVAIGLICTGTAIIGARAEEMMWRDSPDSTSIAYGPPETEPMVTFFCNDRKRMIASMSEPAEGNGKDPVAVEIEGLDGIERVTATPDTGSDGMMDFPIRTGSILVTSVLTGQPVTFRSGKLVTKVPMIGASAGFKRILLVCLGGVAEPTKVGQIELDQSPAPRPGVNISLPRAAKVPRYADYPSSCCATGAVTPILDTPDLYAYRTRLREAGRGRINYAGGYTLAVWGCGASCATGAIVDHRTGRAIFLPGSVIGGNSEDENFEKFNYDPRSRLLVLSGQINEEGPMGMHFYVLEGTTFKKIHFIPSSDTFPDYVQIMRQVRS